ncbi:MAG: phospholipase D family protein [Novosphingobium sp.]|nr:phospholipase D family protein [Novosphingobium sp.]
MAILALSVIAVRILFPLPSLDGRTISATVADTASTPLGQAVAADAATHPGRSGIRAVTSGEDAFAARVALARSATRSLDLQYYIWKRDLSGTLLFDELRAAADRGVRVRLLLDDNVTAGLDPMLAALDAHPNIEIRLFNPFIIRKFRFLGYLTDFPRLNRRMHNKSFTADNQATIVGGRNIGDEYMGAGEGLLFADLDVLAVGQVVGEVSRQFDRYWASRSAYPAGRILGAAGPTELGRLAAEAARIRERPDGERYVEAIRKSALLGQLRQRTVPLEWAETRLVADDPAKGLGLAATENLLFPRLVEIVGKPGSSLSLVSSYFVPTEAGTETFSLMARRGVNVSILTNALEATDVPVVHAGYVPWRQAMLKAGVRLYELRRTGRGQHPNRRGIRRSGSGDGTAIGGSATALHAKTFAIDGKYIFVGSFNFDPRSAKLNTELGLVMQSAALSRPIDEAFTGGIPSLAYEVKLDEDGGLYWLERRGKRVIRHDTEPGTTWFTRATIRVLSLLPIDWLL